MRTKTYTQTYFIKTAGGEIETPLSAKSQAELNEKCQAFEEQMEASKTGFRREEKSLSAIIAANLTLFRQNKNLTQEQLAEAAGVKPSAIANAERAGSTPRVEFLVAVSRALGATLDDVVAGAE